MKKKINFQQLAKTNKLIPYLKRIDYKRKYSNFGPLYNLAVKKVEKYLNLKSFSAIFTSSGDASLNAVFKFIKFKFPNKKFVICPSFAFYSDVNNILSNGFKPLFVDINKDDLTLDDNLLDKIIKEKKGKIAAILFVSPFGYPIPVKKLNSSYKKYKIQIVYDAADTFLNLRNNLPNKNIFITCSFHPTKTLPANESGLILAKKRNLSEFKSIINHGIGDINYKNNIVGFNGKASEYDCAIFLSNFDQIKKKLNKLNRINDLFKKILNKNFIFKNSNYFWYSNKVIFFSKKSRTKINKILKKNNINLYKIWSENCLHEFKKFKHYHKTKMENSLKNKKYIFSFFIDNRFNNKFIKNICEELNKL